MTDGATSAAVATSTGPVRGTVEGGVVRYLGISYAAPPVGERRWRPPAPVAPWPNVLDARAFGPDAMQRNRPASSRAPGVAEDCLNLNIWAPADAAIRGPLPVVVWFYGGSFVHGSAADGRTDGAVFARHGVVFVSVTSRIGIFGWLAHPELVAESPQSAAGNYGLLDQIAALRWLRDNVVAFGGDAERIVPFGVSSGGASIAALIASPLAAGLFGRAILESAGSFRPLADLSTAAASGEALGSLRNLRSLGADEVLALEPRLIPAVRGLTTPRVLRPIRDGWVLPHDERQAFESGAFTPVSAIVGSNADEGSRLTASWPIDDLAGWNRTIESDFPRAADEARRLYPAAGDDDARAAVAAMFGDTQFALGARELARAIDAGRGKAFRYLFTKRRAGMADGPHHGGEVPYVFGHLDEPPYGALPAADVRDRILSAAMQAAWVRFAATGDPGAVDGIEWPSFDHGLIELGDRTAVIVGARDEQLDFLNRYARL